MMIQMRLFFYVFAAVVILTACSGGQSSNEDVTGLVTETAVSPPTSSPTSPSSPTPADFISDDEATALMFTLADGSAADAQEALDRVVAAKDVRFIGVLIELFRSRQIGLVNNLSFDDYIAALQILSGQSFADDWGEWIEWYGQTDLTVPIGFTGWKGQILTRMDGRFGDFLQDQHPSNIRVEEIVWGGVVVDGIPPLDNPTMVEGDKAAFMQPFDAVFGIEINGDARAYPLRIIDWHEMANDVIGGVPVSLAYCTLCGAAIAYDGRASDGSTYTFSSSGFLFRSNKLMYDRQTETLWNQLTGEPVLGALVDTDVQLELLPVVLTTWQDWQNQHPDTVVVDVETGFNRVYTPGAAYGDYFAADITMFPVWQRDEALATKDQVYALNIADTPKAYAIDLLTEAGVVNDVVAETAVTLIASRGIVDVTGASLRSGIEVAYTAGAEVRAYDRGEHEFAPGPDKNSVLDEAGNVWQMTEAALIGPNGEKAARINGHLAYWFGWYAFYPETLVYELEE